MNVGRFDGMHSLAQMRSAFDQSFAVACPVREKRESVIQIRVAGQAFAVRTADIAGLCKSRKIVPVPSRIPALLGVSAIQGALVPVFELAALLGIPSGRSGQSWLVLVGGDTPMGFAFDGFEGQHVPEWLCTEQHARQNVRIGSAVRAVLDIPSLAEGIRKQAGLTKLAQGRKQ